MNEEFDYTNENETVILTDEDGKEIELEFLAAIPYEGKQYVVLLPLDDNEVVILEVIEKGDDNEDAIYVSVDDDDIVDAVFQIFQDQAGDEFEFV